MEDSLLIEYLKSKLSSIHEKDMPERITLPSGEVLVLNGIKYTDRRGNVYSLADIRNIIKSQNQRRRQNLENNKRWKYKPEDRFNDPDYVDGTAGTYGDNEELRIGDIVFYENPNMKRVVDLMKSNQGVAYAVTDNGRILISPDKDFCSWGSLRLIQRVYRVEPEKVGLISMAPRGLIYPGVDGDLVLTKGRYRKQADLVRDAQKALMKALPFCKASPQTEIFIRWVDTAFREWHAPIDEFSFIRWLKKGYSEEEYRGPEPDYTEHKRRQYQGQTASYAPYKAGFGLEDQLRINAHQKINPPSDKDIEKTYKQINVEFKGESKKVADIIDQAYKANKITKQEFVKAVIVLKRAVQNKNDRAIYQLKSIMLKALKG